DHVGLTALAGLRTGDAATYAGGGDEGSLAAALRVAYEIGLGVRASRVSASLGGRVAYDTFVLGDARTYGMTLPLVAALGVRAGDRTTVTLRGHYGEWLVDASAAGAGVAIDQAGLLLLAGLEQLKMPATVSL